MINTQKFKVKVIQENIKLLTFKVVNIIVEIIKEYSKKNFNQK